MTLVAFDFDGTLSDSEMTVLLGERAGVAEKIAEITERAMNDELSYAESLRERVALLEGLPEAHVEAAFDEVELRPGTADVLRALSEAGTTTAILTGGFEAGVERALEHADVSVDVIVANRLPVVDGALDGTVEGSLIEGTKDDALERVAADAGVDPDAAIGVGDGANDIPLLDRAGAAIGFRPKPAVEPHCDIVVESMAELADVLADAGAL